MYDLNQIRYDYTVEVRNKFKGLDLIDIDPFKYKNILYYIEFYKIPLLNTSSQAPANGRITAETDKESVTSSSSPDEHQGSTLAHVQIYFLQRMQLFRDVKGLE